VSARLIAFLLSATLLIGCANPRKTHTTFSATAPYDDARRDAAVDYTSPGEGWDTVHLLFFKDGHWEKWNRSCVNAWLLSSGTYRISGPAALLIQDGKTIQTVLLRDRDRKRLSGARLR
jgi:hypothetical protein